MIMFRFLPIIGRLKFHLTFELLLRQNVSQTERFQRSTKETQCQQKEQGNCYFNVIGNNIYKLSVFIFPLCLS